MNEAQVFITDVKQVISFRGTMNHGIQPSTFVVEIIPQKIENPYVEIAVKYPHPVKAFELKECLIDSSSYSASRSGLISTLYIKDFRWKWAYKRITLLANIRRGDGEIILDPAFSFHKFKMSVEDIIREIEKALSVKITINATIPQDYYPEIIWDNYNAATALHDLISPLALRVVPTYDPDKILICSAGIGVPLPTEDLESFGTDTNPREKPKRIRVVSAPVLMTQDLGLLPVIKTNIGWAYSDSSPYRPIEKRWGNVVGISDEVSSYSNQTGRELTTQECEFVEESAFKWFAITNLDEPQHGEFSDGQVPVLGDEVSGFGQLISSRYSMLRGLQNFICEKTLVVKENLQDVSYILSPRPPFVYGAFYHEQETDIDARSNLTESGNSVDDFREIDYETKEKLSYVEDDTNKENTTENDLLRKYIVPVPFSIDFDTGLVKFSRRVYLIGWTDKEVYFPQLCLRVALKTMKDEDGTFVRLEHVIDVDPKSPADEIYIELNDVVPMFEYSQDIDERARDYEKQLADYAEQILKSLSRPDEAGTATYAGVKRIDLDGAIQTVSWSIGQSGARTTATYNQDTGDSTTISFNARQQAIEIGKAMKDAEMRRTFDRRSAMGLPPL